MTFETFCVWLVVLLGFTLLTFILGIIAGKYPTPFWIVFISLVITFFIVTWNSPAETAKTGSESFFSFLRVLWYFIVFSVGRAIGE